MEKQLIYQSKFESFKMDEESNTGTFTGYASTYNNTDRVGDIILQDAFKGCLESKTIYPMLLNHDRDNIIGKMEVTHDSKGLPVKGTLNLNDPLAKKVFDLMKMGALDSMSVGFRIKDYMPVDEKEPWGGWFIKEAELYEVSVVTIPANTQATVDSVKEAMKNLEENIKALEELFKYNEDNQRGI